MSSEIYHEKQMKELCALHSLNNLFQRQNTFSKNELDEICFTLDPKVWLNPHRSPLGLGNYDINVIMTALENRGYEAIWFDRRKNPNCLRLDRVFGFIMNIPNDYYFGYIRLPFQRRHWITIRKIDSNYYNLDSKQKSPLLIGKDDDLIQYLKQKLASEENQLFVIIDKGDKDWQLKSNTDSSPISTSNERNFCSSSSKW